MANNQPIPLCACGQPATKWTYVGEGTTIFECDEHYNTRNVEVNVPIDSFYLRVTKKMQAVKRLADRKKQ